MTLTVRPETEADVPVVEDVVQPGAVRPGRQRRGVGTVLVTETLERMRGPEEPIVFLEGDPSYYRRLGFEPISTAWVSAAEVKGTT